MWSFEGRILQAVVLKEFPGPLLRQTWTPCGGIDWDDRFLGVVEVVNDILTHFQSIVLGEHRAV